MVAEDFEIIEQRANVGGWANFASGTFGGVAGLLVGHPFDTVKVRLQSQNHLAPKYTSTFHCFTTILRQEKITGLYKGMASPLVGVAVVNAMLFGVYGFALDLQRKSHDDKPTLSQIFLAGTFSGVVNSIVSCPLELAKIRLQNQSSAAERVYKGPLDCFIKTYKSSGIRGCYRGMSITILRETSYGPYFLSYELLCRALAPAGTSPEDLGGIRLVVAGGFAGIFGWMSTYPTDVLKTRIQGQPADTPQHLRYRGAGILDCLRHTVKAEGVPGLFRGSAATVVRAFPCNAATFLAYEAAMRAFVAASV